MDHERGHDDGAPDGARRISSRVLKYLIVGLLAGAALAAPATQTFTGVISDSECGASHASMRMGPTDAECTWACIQAHGASYVLVSGTTVYNLTNQQLPEQFAGQRVRVTGTLDAKTKTIQLERIVNDAPAGKR